MVGCSLLAVSLHNQRSFQWAGPNDHIGRQVPPASSGPSTCGYGLQTFQSCCLQNIKQSKMPQL